MAYLRCLVLASAYEIGLSFCRVVLVASKFEIQFEVDLEHADDV